MGNRKGSTLDISVNIILEADKELYNYEEQYFGTDELEPFFNVECTYLILQDSPPKQVAKHAQCT